MLRRATDADLDAVLAWRNQEANRAVSVSTHVITAEEHRAWWARVQGDPTRAVLVLELDGTPCGVVNLFDIGDPPGTASWGFFLDHDGLQERGSTLGAWIGVMRAAGDHVFGELDVHTLRGEVLEDNDVVRRMNRRFGFVETGVSRVVDDRTFLAIELTEQEHARRRARRRDRAASGG